jgi:NAD-dependent deacetylase
MTSDLAHLDELVEPLCPEDINRAEQAASGADLAIALGSSLSVYPAASIPLVAAQHGAPYVIINSGVTEHDGLPQVTLRIEGDVSDYFPAAVDRALTIGLR